MTLPLVGKPLPNPLLGKLPEGKLVEGRPPPKPGPNVSIFPKSPLFAKVLLNGLALPKTLTLKGDVLKLKLVNELLPNSELDPIAPIALPP